MKHSKLEHFKLSIKDSLNSTGSFQANIADTKCILIILKRSCIYAEVGKIEFILVQYGEHSLNKDGDSEHHITGAEYYPVVSEEEAIKNFIDRLYSNRPWVPLSSRVRLDSVKEFCKCTTVN